MNNKTNNQNNMIKVVPLTPDLENKALALLRKYQETSMFLLSNYFEYGPCLGNGMHSGNYKCIVKNDKEIAAVFCLNKLGSVLIQSDRRQDYSNLILSSCMQESIKVKGVVAAWDLAEPFWKLFCSKRDDVKTTTYSEEVLLSLKLKELSLTESKYDIRFLEVSDYKIWEELNSAYFKEMGFPEFASKEDRIKEFKIEVSKNHWWGLFENTRLISIMAYNSKVENIAQIGGVYTRVEHRKRGLAKLLLARVINDSILYHNLDKLILFTDKPNIAALSLYKGLGFKETDNFGLIFGQVGV